MAGEQRVEVQDGESGPAEVGATELAGPAIRDFEVPDPADTGAKDPDDHTNDPEYQATFVA